MRTNIHPLIPAIAEQLAVTRRQIGVTQSMVAKNAGATQNTVSRFERSQLDPQLSTFLELSRALGLEIRLVPRRDVPVFDALLRARQNPGADAESDRPLYALDPRGES